jgi:hemoglobin
MEMPRSEFVPPINPAQIPGPSREIYPRMGRDNMYRMLKDFYEALGASAIAGLFPKNLVKASERSAAFFVQLCGGPLEYSNQYGPPRMRARHLAFKITQAARDEWLACFERILANAPADYAFPPEHLDDFRRFLRDFSMWMVNSADSV